MTTVILFVFGLLIGSFLNVLGLRWGSSKGFGGRSFCVSCEKSLHWYELIPVISFVGLRGKCSRCKSKISWQYPLVELWTALIFATVPLLTIPVFCIYVVITIYDIRHKIIPENLVYSAIILSFVYRLFIGGALVDWLAGPIFFAFFALLWLLSRGRAMGFGDAKLGLSIGLLLGAPFGLSAFALAFWIGAAVSLLMMLFSKLGLSLFKRAKGLTMKSEIPFAPFLVLGAWLAFVFQFDLLHVKDFFN